MCCSCGSPSSRSRVEGSKVSDHVVVAGVFVRLGCLGLAAWAIADKMLSCRVLGGFVVFTGKVDMELVNRWKCVAYHFETEGCGFLQGVSGTPILHRMLSITKAWSHIGICMVS